MHMPAESTIPVPETQAITRGYPFEFCDRILAQTPDSVEALKTISIDEWCLTGPAPLPLWAVLEIMSQAAGVLKPLPVARDARTILTRIRRARYRRPVWPGDRLR